MNVIRIVAFAIVILYFLGIVLLYFFQEKLIFYPGKLSKDFKFKLGDSGEEVWMKTADGQSINALFYRGHRPEVILYFHGNAGDLSGWQFVAEDFTDQGFNILIIDYRGYGKSSGKISEHGFYEDANAAYHYLLNETKFTGDKIIVYGRSIGTGVAVELASKKKIKALILESPYSSFSKLANEKIPFFFPGLYVRAKFNNLTKINSIKAPIVFIHGSNDTLIPQTHTEFLYQTRKEKKYKIIIEGGGHNDLNSFADYQNFIGRLPEVINTLK